MSIGRNIKKIRKEKNITQNDLANEMGISRSYLGDLENDRRNPSAKTLESLSQKLDVSMTYLLEGEKTWRDLDENERIKYTEKTVKSVSNLFSEREDSARQYLAKIDFDSLNNGEVQYMALAFNVMEMFPEESVDYLTTIFNGLNMLYKTVNDDSKDIDSKKNVIEGRLHESMGELQGLFKKIEENLDKK